MSKRKKYPCIVLVRSEAERVMRPTHYSDGVESRFWPTNSYARMGQVTVFASYEQARNTIRRVWRRVMVPLQQKFDRQGETTDHIDGMKKEHYRIVRLKMYEEGE